MYILLSAHNPWFTPPSCTVSVYTVNSNSVPLSGSSAEHTLFNLTVVHYRLKDFTHPTQTVRAHV